MQTYVVEYSDGLVRDAILRELSRGGQVYVLHNRVQTIEVMYTRLKKLVPEARIAIGHGQMREHALEDVMLDFYDGKFDVLLCTTIIEAGLDVPRANTLIVCDADRFGLAQLYQLRGRVGRSNRLAYAYLTVNPSKVLTEAADKRLAAIREFTEFGSGFRVAMRDLEIRGAGNLLGSEQSGFMATVGYDLYVKMIEETVREMRGDVSLDDIETRVDLKIDAYLPQEYIANDLLRVEMYKKIASIRNRDNRDDLIEELIDRFGDPNRPGDEPDRDRPPEGAVRAAGHRLRDHAGRRADDALLHGRRHRRHPRAHRPEGLSPVPARQAHQPAGALLLRAPQGRRGPAQGSREGDGTGRGAVRGGEGNRDRQRVGGKRTSTLFTLEGGAPSRPIMGDRESGGAF